MHLVGGLRSGKTVSGNGNVVLVQVFNCLFIEALLAMPQEVFKMSGDNRWPLGNNIGHHGLLVIGPGFPFNDRNRSFRACADTGAKPIAEEVAHEACFPLNQLQCSLRTIGDALAASRALFFVDMNDLSFHGILFRKIFTVMFSAALPLVSDTSPPQHTPLHIYTTGHRREYRYRQ